MTIHRFIIPVICSLLSLAGYAATPNDSITADTLLLDDGSLYIGQVRDSLLNGHGRCIFPDGTVYDGGSTVSVDAPIDYMPVFEKV